MGVPVILSSMVSGVFFFTAYQFLFIGLRNRKHLEYLTFGFIVFLQAMCVLYELFGVLSYDQQVYSAYRHTYYNITGGINVLFFLFIRFVSGYRHRFIFIVYLLIVILTILLNNTLTVKFVNKEPYYFQFFNHYFPRPWSVRLNALFGVVNILQYVPLAIFSLKACRFQRINSGNNTQLIIYSLIFFVVGSMVDLIIDLGVVNYPLSSIFYLILAVYISNKLLKKVEEVKEIEDKLSEGEQRLRQIIDLVPNLIFAKDRNGKFLLANKALADIYGITPDELTGRTHEDFFHVPNEINFFREKDNEVFRNGKPVAIPEETITDKDGNVLILQTVKIPFSYAGHDAILGVSNNITAVKEAEFNVRNNEQLLEAIFENASVAMVLVDKGAGVVKINKAGKDLKIDTDLEYTGTQPGNVFKCVVAYRNSQGCGKGKECSTCVLRFSIQSTFESKKGFKKVPYKMTMGNDKAEREKDILLSTSYVEINDSPLAILVLEDVSSLMRVEEELLDSEFRYKQITRAITDYIYTIIYDQNEIATIHTQACFFITGYKADEFELTPSLWFDIIVDDDRERVMDFIKNGQNYTDSKSIEYRIICKNGNELWVSNTLVKKIGTGLKKQYDGVIRDITKQKVAERELDRQNKLLNTMLDNLPIGIFMVRSSDGSPLLVNEQAKKLLGRGVVPNANIENLSQVYKAYKVGTDRIYPMNELPIYMGLQGKYGHIDDLEIEHDDGTRALLEIVGCPVYDVNNNIWASLVGFYDITARKNAELALLESKRKLSITFEYSHVGIALIENSGHIEYMNPAFCQLLDYQPDQIIEDNFSFISTGTDTYGETKQFDKLRNGEVDVLDYEKRFYKKDGKEIWVQMQVSCFKDVTGQVANFIVVVEDITERKNALDALKLSEEKFRNIFNTSHDAIVITDFESRIYEVNQIFLDRSGFTLEKFGNVRLIDIIPPGDREEALMCLKGLGNNKPAFFQTTYINQNGAKIYLEIIGHAVNYYGKPAALLVSRDITDRVALQQKILNAIIEAEEKERSSFSQELHDGLGPLLSTIKLYLEWIQNPGAKSNKSILLTDALNTIEEAISGIKEISNRLSPSVLKKFGLETAIRSFIKKIESLGESRFDVKIKLAQRLRPEIEAMLYRVLVEAINNSLKYANASNIFIHLESNEHRLYTMFRDDGVGFNPDEVSKRDKGHGLFNMQHRVETYEGAFSLYSMPGEGTQIEISIPEHKYLLTNGL